MTQEMIHREYSFHYNNYSNGCEMLQLKAYKLALTGSVSDGSFSRNCTTQYAN